MDFPAKLSSCAGFIAVDLTGKKLNSRARNDLKKASGSIKLTLLHEKSYTSPESNDVYFPCEKCANEEPRKNTQYRYCKEHNSFVQEVSQMQEEFLRLIEEEEIDTLRLVYEVSNDPFSKLLRVYL